MNSTKKTPQSRIKSMPRASAPLQHRGFSLVITVSMVVLLTVVAVGLLSLSTISLKSSSIDSAQKRAQANARMGLQMAIDQLQMSLGPDQMISANAAILSDQVSHSGVAHPHWVGAWHSWRAGDLDPSMTRIDTESDHQTIPGVTGAGMHPTYAPKRSDHFKNWLVSLTDEEAETISTPLDLVLNGSTQPDGNADAVCLVGPGTLGEAAPLRDYVKARLIDVYSAPGDAEIEGRYGWWVGDESQKARIMGDPYADQEPNLRLGDALFRQQSAGSTGARVADGLENITDEQQLSSLPSLETIDLVENVDGTPSDNFHHITTASLTVLSDVREGGLKRDLSILLEKPININDTGDEFMLYRFDDQGQERVPIQDLAAYYQLYTDSSDWENGGRGGLVHDAEGLRLRTPDYGTAVDEDRDRYLRQYTTLYRNPVPIKVEFLLAFGSEPIPQGARDFINQRAASDSRFLPLRDEDTHMLRLGSMPVVTLWNPNNVPLVMDQPMSFMVNCPPFAYSARKYFSGKTEETGWMNINYCQSQSSGDGRARREGPHVINMRFASTQPVVFEPGEVKLFSLPAETANSLTDEFVDGASFERAMEPINEWDPYGFFKFRNSSLQRRGNDDYAHNIGYSRLMVDTPAFGRVMVFGPNDKIAVQIGTEVQRKANGRVALGTNVSPMNEVHGSGFCFSMIDTDLWPRSNGRHHFRHYMFMSRYGGTTSTGETQNAEFNGNLMKWGFPGQVELIPYDTEANAIPGSQIIAAQASGEVTAFMQFSMAAGCETNSLNLGGYGGGRRVTTRPFLHGATLSAPFIDQHNGNHLYNVGWQWQVDRINNVEDSTIQGVPGTGYGFYGGGYSIEAGTTHVLQRDIPVAPPFSIAALSSAHLGGFSLANDPVAFGGDDLINWKGTRGDRPWREGPPEGWQKVTATGQAGLGPHTLQAIGNSYAHPNIAADQAYKTWERYFDSDQGDPANGIVAPVTQTYVDHSYLANKALWDEYFFSSITPQPSENPVFYSEGLTAAEVAENFLFHGVPLPNSRMTSFPSGLYQDGFSETFDSGMVDEIAAHMMVKGAFNINSTSVEAWKIFFSSLRNKSVASIDKEGLVENSTVEGVPVGPGILPGGDSENVPVLSSDIAFPNEPANQWTGWRVLTDQEIEQLAVAMVKQVKARGPFLSLSEFVNRRLDGANRALSVKGALQAALDDPDVSINAAFRNTTRSMSNAEIAMMDPEFPEALEGPVAYGSAAYVDQADVLRHFGSQLTPRGDTFVIRSYGDALDATGNVIARAWCEAVVQRIPEYVDSNDDPHLATADLPDTSIANRRFGRKLEVVSFRWLHASEL